MEPVVESRKAKIVMEHATKYFETRNGYVRAVEDFTADVKEGELVCILGPSGCGKSVLLWAIAGIHPLTKGRILFDGQPVTSPRPDQGIVFQEANLLPWRNVIKNVLFPIELKRWDKKKYEDRIANLLQMVDLDGFEKKMPRELSGGMQQRVAIVRALSFDPQVLLLDEPFGALDAFTRDEMNMLLLKIWAETKKTVVFVTHNVTEAIFLADRLLVMTARPGTLAKEIVVDLPRPRSLDMITSRKFIDYVTDVKQTILAGEGVTTCFDPNVSALAAIPPAEK
jgi:NitT/TauT family transport system ATP-binding protein